MNDDEGPLTVELYVRSFSTATDSRRETIERLERLEAEGSIDSFTVERWGDKVDLTGDDRTVDAYRRFREWSEERGVSITPPFAVRTYRSAFTGEACDVLVTPIEFLSVYDDGELHGLFPHQNGDTTTTIDDYLSALEADESAATSPSRHRAAIQ